MKEFLSEMALMSIVRHPNVAHLLGGCVVPGNYFIVSKFYPLGSLDVLISKQKAVPGVLSPFTRARTAAIIMQIARAMKYLHSLGIIHRDLKCGNVLVDTDWTVAVCDFGVSRCVDTLNMTRGVGTPLYTAPEVLEGTVYDGSADVYSFAVCCWQVLTQQEPYKGINFMQLVPKIVQEQLRPPLSPQTEPYNSLLQSAWQDDPSGRPSFQAIVTQLKALAEGKKGVGKILQAPNKSSQRSRAQTSGLAKVGTSRSLRVSMGDIEYK